MLQQSLPRYQKNDTRTSNSIFFNKFHPISKTFDSAQKTPPTVLIPNRKVSVPLTVQQTNRRNFNDEKLYFYRFMFFRGWCLTNTRKIVNPAELHRCFTPGHGTFCTAAVDSLSRTSSRAISLVKESERAMKMQGMRGSDDGNLALFSTCGG